MPSLITTIAVTVSAVMFVLFAFLLNVKEMRKESAPRPIAYAAVACVIIAVFAVSVAQQVALDYPATDVASAADTAIEFAERADGGLAVRAPAGQMLTRSDR